MSPSALAEMAAETRATQEAREAVIKKRAERLAFLKQDVESRREQEKLAILASSPPMARTLMLHVAAPKLKWWAAPRVKPEESKMNLGKWGVLSKEEARARREGRPWPPPDPSTVFEALAKSKGFRSGPGGVMYREERREGGSWEGLAAGSEQQRVHSEAASSLGGYSTDNVPTNDPLAQTASTITGTRAATVDGAGDSGWTTLTGRDQVDRQIGNLLFSEVAGEVELAVDRSNFREIHAEEREAARRRRRSSAAALKQQQNSLRRPPIQTPDDIPWTTGGGSGVSTSGDEGEGEDFIF